MKGKGQTEGRRAKASRVDWDEVRTYGWSTSYLAVAGGVTKGYIAGLCRCGALPAVRIGRDWRIRREDGDAWLEGRVGLGK